LVIDGFAPFTDKGNKNCKLNKNEDRVNKRISHIVFILVCFLDTESYKIKIIIRLIFHKKKQLITKKYRFVIADWKRLIDYSIKKLCTKKRQENFPAFLTLVQNILLNHYLPGFCFVFKHQP